MTMTSNGTRLYRYNRTIRGALTIRYYTYTFTPHPQTHTHIHTCTHAQTHPRTKYTHLYLLSLFLSLLSPPTHNFFVVNHLLNCVERKWWWALYSQWKNFTRQVRKLFQLPESWRGRNENPTLQQCLNNASALRIQKSLVTNPVWRNCSRKRHLYKERAIDTTPLPKRKKAHPINFCIFIVLVENKNFIN